MIKQMREMRWTILLALFVTLVASQVIAPLLLEARKARMDAEPVVTMRGEIVARDGKSVTIHLWGVKHRTCTYISINSYTAYNGVMRDVNTRRTNPEQSGVNLPVGKFDLGDWLVWPVDGATRVLMYSQHDCDGRVVITKIAEVDL